MYKQLDNLLSAETTVDSWYDDGCVLAMETCPNCGHVPIRFQYVGDLRVRIGFLDIWCDSCRHGIHISRAKAPEPVSMISFEDGAEYKRVVPEFNRIEPS